MMIKVIIRYSLLFMTLMVSAACSNPDGKGDIDRIVDQYNYTAGTQTIGARYRFTEDPTLVETAKRILEMGSNMIKMALTPIEGDEELVSWKEAMPKALASENPILKNVLDMDFSYYFMWVTTPGVNWNDGMTEEESELEYKAIRELAEYLLKEYEGSNKHFFIGHWEGDWLLLGNYSRTQERIDPVRIEGMTSWFKIRQKAIEDARDAVESKDVEVFHYLELNRVNPTMRTGADRIVNTVLPYVDVDYVSYSSYESTSEEISGADYEELKSYLGASLDFIESHLKPNPSIQGRRIFIGEYGYSLPIVGNDPQEQARRAVNTIRAAIEWGCLFVLYWEMYDNEGDDKGFWMIDSHNEKQPVYEVHSNYYKHMRSYVREYVRKNGHAPSSEDFRESALDYLSSL